MVLDASTPGQADADRPAMREGTIVHRIGDEAVVWSDVRPEPAHLDAVATVMIDVIDGVATTSELIEDVQSALGIDHYDARAQVKRVLNLLDGAGVLTTSVLSDLPLVAARPLLPEPDW